MPATGLAGGETALIRGRTRFISTDGGGATSSRSSQARVSKVSVLGSSSGMLASAR